jgi:hypothetical protein
VTGAQFSEVDFDLLADYVGGALADTPDEAAVAALVTGDPAWRTAYDELVTAMAAVGVELNALGATPEPMPAELAARLDAAFASAVADPAPIDPELAGSAKPHVVPSRHLSVVPDDRDQGVREGKRATVGDRRRRLRWAVPIAAAAGVIAFLGVGINYLNGQSRSQSDEAATSSAAGAGPVAQAPLSSSDDAGRKVLASGTDYRHATLGRAPEATAMAAPGRKTFSAPAPVGGERAAGDLQRLSAAGSLQACLDAIAAQNGAGPITAHTVDLARYAGAPAVIVRFSAANGEWAWASGPDCGTPGLGAAKLDAVKVG